MMGLLVTAVLACTFSQGHGVVRAEAVSAGRGVLRERLAGCEGVCFPIVASHVERERDGFAGESGRFRELGAALRKS